MMSSISNIFFRIGSLQQTTDSTLVATEFSGSRAATFRLWTDVIAMKSLNGFVQGVSATRDGTCLIFCCSDTKTANKKHAVNGHISITNLSLEVQMQLNINTSGYVIKYAVQKSNGDFIAATTKTCFILSSLGCVKSSFNFVGTMHGACLDRQNNFIIVRDNDGSKVVTVLDSKLEGRKDLITLTETLNVNAKYSMAIDEQGDVWLSYGNTIQCIRYTL